MARRTVGIVLAGVGVLGIVGSVVWRNVAVPNLVKYPTDVDESPVYEGTVTIYLDQKTYAPLAEPIVAPLTVTRHIEALGDESSSDLVVISETLDLNAEGQFTGTLEAQYVMDRKDINNVKDDRAWAFSPDNVVDRSPDFRLAFPFDTPSEPMPIYNNEVEQTYTANPAGEGEIDGMKVIRFTGEQTEPLPVSAAYFAALTKLTPLPTELTLTQLTPILKQAGIDVETLIPALLPNLTPEDVQTLVALQGQPVKLDYVFTFSGSDAVEPSTGSIVQVSDVVQTLYAQPDPAVLPKLQEVLARYPNVPAAVDAVAGLQKLAANPIKVFENSFSQTDESVADIASTVKDAKNAKKLAETTIPTALLIGGIVLAVAGLILILTGRRKRRPAEPAAGVAAGAASADITSSDTVTGAPAVPDGEAITIVADPPAPVEPPVDTVNERPADAEPMIDVTPPPDPSLGPGTSP